MKINFAGIMITWFLCCIHAHVDDWQSYAIAQPASYVLTDKTTDQTNNAPTQESAGRSFAAPPRLTDQLDRIQAIQHELDAELELSIDDHVNSQSNPFESILNRLHLSELESTRQVNEISERIRLLTEWERANFSQRMLKLRDANLTEEKTLPHHSPGVVPGTTPRPTSEGQMIDVPIEADVDENETEPNLLSESSEALAAQKILNQPTDELALANNLFHTDECELALEVYRRIGRQTSQDLDKLWIDYQVAACLRRLGRIGEAQSQLRDIANRDLQDPLVKLAQWWLDALDRKQQFKSQLQIMENFINAKKKEIYDGESATRIQ